jgi:DNA-directed RNA polymerase subunit F
MDYCGFHFPENLMPPSPEELKEIYETKQNERRMSEITEFIRKLGIDL